MAKGYWIARADVHDADGYKSYVAANPAIFKKFGGRFLVRGGQFECPEGGSRARNIVIEFPDYADGARLLPLAGVPGEHAGTAANLNRRYRDHRGLRRPAAVNLQAQDAKRGLSDSLPRSASSRDVGRGGEGWGRFLKIQMRMSQPPTPDPSPPLADARGRRGAARPPLLRYAAAAIVLAVFAMISVVVGAGFYLSAPAPAVIGAPPPDLPAETVTIASDSGATLRGWFMQGRPGGGAVVLLHGVKGNRLAMLRRARLLHAEGFSVLLFDFQAHGESTGARITFGRLEGLDATAAVAYVRQRLPDERVGAIGSSLGGAAALLGPQPLAVDALVLESVYPDIGSAIANRVRIVLGPVVGAVAARPTAWMFEAILPPFLGMRPSELRPSDGIARVTASLLIASGTADTRTTMAETQAMFARAPEPKQLWAVEGMGHVDLEEFAPDEYRRRVVTFLANHLRPR